MLPPLEWVLDTSETGILTEEFKLMDPVGANRGIAPANLVPDLYREIEAMARRAFNVLGFVITGVLTSGFLLAVMLFFLEANTTPSLEPLEALAVSAQNGPGLNIRCWWIA